MKINAIGHLVKTNPIKANFKAAGSRPTEAMGRNHDIFCSRRIYLLYFNGVPAESSRGVDAYETELQCNNESLKTGENLGEEAL